jgi:hypothetical protein
MSSVFIQDNTKVIACLFVFFLFVIILSFLSSGSNHPLWYIHHFKCNEAWKIIEKYLMNRTITIDERDKWVHITPKYPPELDCGILQDYTRVKSTDLWWKKKTTNYDSTELHWMSTHSFVLMSNWTTNTRLTIKRQRRPLWNLLNRNKGRSRRGDGYGWYPSECQATFDDNI